MRHLVLSIIVLTGAGFQLSCGSVRASATRVVAESGGGGRRRWKHRMAGRGGSAGSSAGPPAPPDAAAPPEAAREPPARRTRPLRRSSAGTAPAPPDVVAPPGAPQEPPAPPGGGSAGRTAPVARVLRWPWGSGGKAGLGGAGGVSPVRPTATARASAVAAGSASTPRMTLSIAAAEQSLLRDAELLRERHLRSAAAAWSARCASARSSVAGATAATPASSVLGDAGSVGHRLLRPRQRHLPHGLRGVRLYRPDDAHRDTGGSRHLQLRVGDLVYSMDRGQLALVPSRRSIASPSTSTHRMVELRLAHGVSLLVSPSIPPPTAAPSARCRGDRLDGVPVVGARLVSYDQPFTYDILPASDSGTYFAGGVLIGSTIARSRGGGDERAFVRIAAQGERRAGRARTLTPRASRATRPRLFATIAVAALCGLLSCGSARFTGDASAVDSAPPVSCTLDGGACPTGVSMRLRRTGPRRHLHLSQRYAPPPPNAPRPSDVRLLLHRPCAANLRQRLLLHLRLTNAVSKMRLENAVRREPS